MQLREIYTILNQSESFSHNYCITSLIHVLCFHVTLQLTAHTCIFYSKINIKIHLCVERMFEFWLNSLLVIIHRATCGQQATWNFDFNHVPKKDIFLQNIFIWVLEVRIENIFRSAHWLYCTTNSIQQTMYSHSEYIHLSNIYSQ